MTRFGPQQLPFVVTGINCREPADRVPKGKLPFASNTRSYRTGSVAARPGLTSVVSGFATPLHSIVRFNDDEVSAAQPYTIIVGGWTNLYAGAPPSTSPIDTGYSGNPLSMVTYLPDAAIRPFLYIGDSSRMAKVDVSGNVFHWGIAAPAGPPATALTVPLYTVIDTFDSTLSWAPVGPASGTVTQAVRIEDASSNPHDEITAIVYDTGTTGWCSVMPATPQDGYQQGMTLDFAGGTAESVIVQSVKFAMTSTTVSAILYDAGTTGLCSMTLAALTTDAAITQAQDLQDCILQTGVQYLRILSATIGPDGTYSIRTKTATTVSAGATIAGVYSLRTSTVQAHTAAETLTAFAAYTVITAPGSAPFQAGIVQNPLDHDCGVIGTRPSSGDDYIHVSLNITGLSSLIEGRIWFDVDGQTNDFSHNYYYYAFTPPDLATALQESFDPTTTPTPISDVVGTAVTSTVVANAAQAQTRPGTTGAFTARNPPNAQVPATAAPAQTGFGDGQWLELVFRISDLTRIGTDSSRTLANIAATQVTLTMAGSGSLAVAGFWFGGSYGPDIGQLGQAYQYRYRGGSSISGAQSNPSPATRNGIAALRQGIVVSGVQHPDAQVDTIFLERYGGQLQTWQPVGQTPNGSTWSFLDTQDDETVVIAPQSVEDSYQPFPSTDQPQAGTVNVAGTTIKWVSGSHFSTAWLPGTAITINGVNTTLFASPISTTQVEITDNLGALSGAAFTIQEPDLGAQPTPIVFMHPDGFLMGLGEAHQPGTLFWTNRYRSDTANDTNTLFITDASDILQNGGVLYGNVYLVSRKKIFQITPDYSNVNVFQSSLLFSGHGLVGRWGFAVGPVIGFVDEDGIYEFDGFSPPKSITNDDLYPLFTHDGQPGTSVTLAGQTIAAPNFADASSFQLKYTYGWWQFEYLGLDSVPHTLCYDRANKAWWYDTYAPGVVTHYQVFADEVTGELLAGGADGGLYQVTGSDDAGTAIAWTIVTPSDTGGDFRTDKLFGDGMLDFDPQGSGVGISVTPYLNVYETSLGAVSVAAGSGRQRVPVDFASGAGGLGISVGALIDVAASGPAIFTWCWAVIPKVEQSAARQTDWDNAGLEATKYVQGVLIRADTFNQAKSIKVAYDGGHFAVPTLSVTGNGDTLVPYSFDPPVLARLLKLVPQDSKLWRLYDAQWVFTQTPEAVLAWISQATALGVEGFKHCFLAGVAHVSTADLTLTLTIDGVADPYDIPNSGGAYAKTYVQLKAHKGKLVQPSVVSTAPFQFDADNSEIIWAAWTGGRYQAFKAFGGPRVAGARI